MPAGLAHAELAASHAATCCPPLQAAEAGGAGAQRDLSSARMHLRGLLKQAQDRYGDEPAFTQLQELLQQVEEAQQRQHAAAQPAA